MDNSGPTSWDPRRPPAPDRPRSVPAAPIGCSATISVLNRKSGPNRTSASALVNSFMFDAGTNQCPDRVDTGPFIAEPHHFQTHRCSGQAGDPSAASRRAAKLSAARSGSSEVNKQSQQRIGTVILGQTYRDGRRYTESVMLRAVPIFLVVSLPLAAQPPKPTEMPRTHQAFRNRARSQVPAPRSSERCPYVCGEKFPSSRRRRFSGTKKWPKHFQAPVHSECRRKRHARRANARRRLSQRVSQLKLQRQR